MSLDKYDILFFFYVQTLKVQALKRFYQIIKTKTQTSAKKNMQLLSTIKKRFLLFEYIVFHPELVFPSNKKSNLSSVNKYTIGYTNSSR